MEERKREARLKDWLLTEPAGGVSRMPYAQSEQHELRRKVTGYVGPHGRNTAVMETRQKLLARYSQDGAWGRSRAALTCKTSVLLLNRFIAAKFIPPCSINDYYKTLSRMYCLPKFYS
jgi:hypothetical protein